MLRLLLRCGVLHALLPTPLLLLLWQLLALPDCGQGVPLVVVAVVLPLLRLPLRLRLELP